MRANFAGAHREDTNAKANPSYMLRFILEIPLVVPGDLIVIHLLLVTALSRKPDCSTALTATQFYVENPEPSLMRRSETWPHFDRLWTPLGSGDCARRLSSGGPARRAFSARRRRYVETSADVIDTSSTESARVCRALLSINICRTMPYMQSMFHRNRCKYLVIECASLQLLGVLSLSQLSRARGGFSDKFGHENCVILGEPALRRF